MAPSQAMPPPRRRPSSAMASSSSSSAMRALDKRSPSPPRRRPPNRSTNQYVYDDDDDLDLPVVQSKPLSSADSIAKFHRVRIVGMDADLDVHTRRANHSHRQSTSATRKRSSSTSSTASSVSTVSTCSSSSSSSSRTSPFTAKTKARAHQRPKYHAAASAKQVGRQNKLSSLVLHSVTPRDQLPSSSSSSSSSSISRSYTEYEVVVENVRTSQLWQVARRFSSFVQFRKELSALFATPHCHHCTVMHAKLDELHDDFPAKRLWGSHAKHVTAQRARKLQVYLHGLLALAAKSHTKQCRLIASSFAMHVRGFLTVESTRFDGIPGGDQGHRIPSLLQELSQTNTGAVVAASNQRLPLATILENVPSQSIRTSPWDDHDGIALLEKDEDDETEDEEDASPSSGDNQHERN